MNEGVNVANACGILLHQRPLLKGFYREDDPKSSYLRSHWIATADEEITDASLAHATYTIDGMNLLFLKVLVDGNPEIINVEMDAGEFLTAERLLKAPKTICLHLTNDAASDFVCRQCQDITFLASLRHLRVLSHLDPTRVAVPALPFHPGARESGTTPAPPSTA